MKVSIVMGRGIEGCGVTKFTLEQAQWCKNNGIDYTIYSAKDKSWTRKNAHDTMNIVQLKLAKPAETDILIKGCNDSDFVIINSLPSIGHPEECIKQFKRALEEIKKPIVLIQHDHNSLSIKRNAAINEAIENSNVLFSHSKTNDFANHCDSIIGPTVHKHIFGFQPGLNFDAIRNLYWKSIEDQDPLHNKWIGRSASWKGAEQMFKFHNEYLRRGGYITTLEGIDRGPGFPEFIKISEMDVLLDKDAGSYPLETDHPSYVFGHFVNTEMLERLSKVGFGYQLSILADRFIDRSIEYTHCEVVCTGTVPVFRKSYGERCTHRHYEKKLIDCKNSGTIWLDDNDMKPAFTLLDKLAKDNVMRDEYREMAYEFYKLHQDSSYTFKEIFNTIEKEVLNNKETKKMKNCKAQLSIDDLF